MFLNEGPEPTVTAAILQAYVLNGCKLVNR